MGKPVVVAAASMAITWWMAMATITPSFTITTTNSTLLQSVSTDFGGMTHKPPVAVLHPSSSSDIAAAISSIYNSPSPIPISARGHGHSTHGQAGAENGLVISMHGSDGTQLPAPPPSPVMGSGGRYVDVWGGELWVDVLRWTLENGGLAPRSWTDYLYLSVGGTLSNAGVSGQAFRHGPQISNVHELDVVTGRGELKTCSKKQNQELFHAVLGGLGQFGIITRARIALQPAPYRVRWVRLLYSNFTEFRKDQEYLISAMHGRKEEEMVDYVEGFVILDGAAGLISNWRSSFFSPANPIKITNLTGGGGTSCSSILYCLELAKNYYHGSSSPGEAAMEGVLEELNHIPGAVFTTDLPYVEFLNRVHKAELKLRSKGLWDVAHPWLNLFVPSSKMAEFDRGVFRSILGANHSKNTKKKHKKKKKTNGPIVVYPMSRCKWDGESSAVLPEDDDDGGNNVFYLVGFLRSAVERRSLRSMTRQNERILEFCHEHGVGCKQYLPHFPRQEDWKVHFGKEGWERFVRRKLEFDPRGILGSGNGIFRLHSMLNEGLLVFEFT